MEDIGSITKQLLQKSNTKQITNQVYDNIKDKSKQVYNEIKDNSKQVYDNIKDNSKQVYNEIKDNSKQVYNEIKDNKDDDKDDNTFDTNFGDISDIQIPYEIIPNHINYSEQNYYLEEEESPEENFCSYILYFIIILICLGYIGYNLGSEKVISVESMNGITMGLLTGMIIVNLLWSSIKNN
jgi:gas vesicle protein